MHYKPCKANILGFQNVQCFSIIYFLIYKSIKNTLEANRRSIMRKAIVAAALAVVLVMSAGCEGDGPIRIGVSEEVITEKKEFTGFTSVDAGSAFEVEITRSDSFSVVISAEESLFDYVEVTKTGNELKIYLNPRHIFTDFTIGAKTLKAEITMPAIDELRLSGASRGTITGFRSTSDFDADVSGASKLEIVDCQVGNADIEVSGASKISGNVTAADIEFEVSGASTAELSGTADDMALDVSGASKANMADFLVRDADVEVSGASEATVNVKGKLDIELSGASRLYFYGNPNIGRQDVSGASTIKHK